MSTSSSPLDFPSSTPDEPITDTLPSSPPQNPENNPIHETFTSSVHNETKMLFRQFSSGSVLSRSSSVNSMHSTTSSNASKYRNGGSSQPLYYEDLEETYKGLDIASFKSLREVLRSKKGGMVMEDASQNGAMTGGYPALDTARSFASTGTIHHVKHGQKRRRPGMARQHANFSHHNTKRAASMLGFYSQQLVHPQVQQQPNRLEIHSADRAYDVLHEELTQQPQAHTKFTRSKRATSPNSSTPNPFSKKINMQQLIKQWDAAPPATKNKFLRQFYDQFKDVATFRNMEQQMEHYTYLWFMRFTAYLRMQYLHRRAHSLSLQLRVLKLFLKGQKPLLQFLEIGGTAVLMDILCDSKQVPEVRIEAIDLISLICGTGKKYKEIVVGVEGGLESLERVSLFGELSEEAFLKLQPLWIDLCKNNPNQFEHVEEALVRMFNRCRRCVTVSLPLSGPGGISSELLLQEGAILNPSPLTRGGGGYPSVQNDAYADAPSQTAEQLVRSVLMLCRVFRELHQQHIGLRSLLSKESIDTQIAFLLHHEFPQVQLEVTHLLLHNIEQDDASIQMHIAERLIQILSQHSDGTNTRNIPGCSRLILRLLNTQHQGIIELFLRCQVHLLLFDAMRDLNPIDYLVDTVKHICATIHFLLQFADPKQSDMIREGVSKRIGSQQADTIEFGNSVSTEFALHVQDCLISY